jgi:hypothetical protein
LERNPELDHKNSDVVADGHSIPADPKLLADGWERRHLADPDRAKEAIEVYSSLGFEVKAQQLTPADFGSNCGDCASVICQSYVLIYTRRPK